VSSQTYKTRKGETFYNSCNSYADNVKTEGSTTRQRKHLPLLKQYPDYVNNTTASGNMKKELENVCIY
jgi:hypothetical protein